MIERNGAIAVAWLMESARVALSRAEKTERELEDEKQKVANLEEYMLKGVKFRDELQEKLCRARKALVNHGQPHWARCLDVEKALSSTAPCPHAEEAKRWKEYAEHQEHCATCGEAVSDCAEGSELRRRDINRREDRLTGPARRHQKKGEAS